MSAPPTSPFYVLLIRPLPKGRQEVRPNNGSSNPSLGPNPKPSPRFHKCDICDKTFLQKRYLAVHKKKFHNVPPPNPRAPDNHIRYRCTHCEKEFRCQTTRRNHERKVHNYFFYSKQKLKCPNCTYECLKTKEMIEHMSVVHSDIAIKTEEYSFETDEAFQKWKSDTEKQSLSFFTLHGRTQSRSTLIRYYKCHRNGVFKSFSKGIRSGKLRGTNKIQTYCPAGIIAKTYKSSGKKIFVKFTPNHVGHECEVNRLYLSKSEKNKIAELISSGMSIPSIQQKICETAPPGTRLALTTAEDIRNIAASYGMKPTVARGSNSSITVSNYVAVSNWIKRMLNQENTPVLLYKLPCENVELSDEDDEDFVLGIMTKAQENHLLHFGHKILFMDSTNGSNKYNIQLTSLMVVDDNEEGFPVAFIWSTKQDEEIYKQFFMSIKLRVGNLEPNAFMSDNHSLFYNAFCCIFQPTKYLLISEWYLRREWKKNLSNGKTRVLDLKKRNKIMNTLHELTNETDVITFTKHLRIFTEDLLNDESTAAFGNHFLVHYAHRTEQWAACHRVAAGINTNMIVEKWHKGLKDNSDGKGKGSSRLSKGLHSLMKSLEVKLMNRHQTKQEDTQGKSDEVSTHADKFPKKMSSIRKAHKAAIEIIETVLIIQQNECNWIVTSGSNCGESYEVSKQNLEPDHACNVHCDICNMCLHELSCNCQNATRKFNICKHMHVLCITGNYVSNRNLVENVTEEEQYIEDNIEEQYIESTVEEEYIESSIEEEYVEDSIKEECIEDIEAEECYENDMEEHTEEQEVTDSDTQEANSSKNIRAEAISSVLSLIPEIENFMCNEQFLEVIKNVNALKNKCHSFQSEDDVPSS